jgi:hypothetical protein
MPVAYEGGDTIFGIDRQVEAVLLREIEIWPAECKPLMLIAEGLGGDGKRVFGGTADTLKFRLLVDPIDGSRGLMYDKRSAWFLAAVAHDHGDQTRLSDAFAAAMVELPTSKQAWCDSYLATKDSRTVGLRSRAGGDDLKALQIRPSCAKNLEFGFAQVSNFFPGTKVLAAELMERIAADSLGRSLPDRALIFDDQYISTGGQMVELICGHDRFCCDLRPLFAQIAKADAGEGERILECHPYDVAGALVARQAGVIITDGFGNSLDSTMDVSTGIHWCGYANQAIADLVQPIINRWLSEHDILPGG